MVVDNRSAVAWNTNACFRIYRQHRIPFMGRERFNCWCVAGSSRATFSHGVENLSAVPLLHAGVWGARGDCQEGAHGEAAMAPAGVWVPTAVRLRALSSAERSENRSNAHEARKPLS